MIKQGMFARHDPVALAIWQKSIVGIAGAGGLGSVVANTLTRTGVGTLIIDDFDIIQASNLNRQLYFQDQIGMPKVNALKQNLLRINPEGNYIMHTCRITEENVEAIFGSADILIEAFDSADQKQMLIECWQSLYPKKPIIAASGLAGWGKTEKLHVRQSGNLYICGDEETELDGTRTPLAPRVGIVANMQANLAIQLLLELHS